MYSVLYLDWTGLDEDEDAHVWEDNWDDDNVEDDFSNQLRYSGPILKFSRPNSQIEFFLKNWIIVTTENPKKRLTNPVKSAAEATDHLK